VAVVSINNAVEALATAAHMLTKRSPERYAAFVEDVRAQHVELGSVTL
jgi:hypothetical protein